MPEWWNHAASPNRRPAVNHPADSRRGGSAAWGRPASPGEIDLGRRFVALQATRYQDGGTSSLEATQKALLDFCHAILNTNEFVTLD